MDKIVKDGMRYMDYMDKLRGKWDDAIKDSTVTYSVKVIGAVLTFVSAMALMKLFPFENMVSGQILMLIPVIIGVFFIINETLCMFAFAAFLIITLSGGVSAITLTAGIICLISCTSSRFICLLSVLTPWLLMSMDGIGEPLVNLSLGYMIFFISVYFNERVAATPWKYIYPVYFTLLAYNFNLYGQIVDYTGVVSAVSDLNIPQMFITYADYRDSFAGLDYMTIVILLIINILISYVMGKMISSENVKFLNMRMDIRDGIAFGAGIIVFIAGAFVPGIVTDISVKIDVIAVIWQGAAAYVLTRPLASYRMCERLKLKKAMYEEQMERDAIAMHEYSKSAGETIEGIMKPYLSPALFRNIVKAGRHPVNAALVIGESELDKKLIVNNLLRNISVNVIYVDAGALLEEYANDGSIKFFEDVDKRERCNVIVIDEIENLVSNSGISDSMRRQMLKYVEKAWEEHELDPNVIFMATSSHPEVLPNELFGESGMSRVVYGSIKDSILLNDTYRLIRQIGSGGSSIVYKAVHERLDVTVVVKQITGEFSNRVSYKAEAEILKKIKHASLPKVYDVFENEGEFYTVMDYIPGKSLRELMKEKGAQDQRSVLNWSRQLTDAVAYLHEQEKPIIHSDIKPGNIILMPDGNVSLIDFNISLMFGNGKDAGIGVTPGYSPVEQYGGLNNYLAILDQLNVKRKSPLKAIMKGHEETVLLHGNEAIRDHEKEMEVYAGKGISERSDIYSIGATMYALLTGKDPSPDFYDIEPLKASGRDIDESLVSIVDKAMNIDPDKRYGSVKELNSAINAIQLK